MADRANVTPSVLKWARESAKLAEEITASKVNVEVERLREWEAGTSQPTIRQAETLAKFYKRPFALLFLPSIPNDFQPLQDFRRKDARPLGTASTFIIRELQQKQAWVRQLYEDGKEEKLPFVGRFKVSSKPENVALDILTTLQIDPRHYSSQDPLKEWVTKAEEAGIFISRASFIHTRMKIDSDELQGFVIADEFAPFVFINSDDWSSAQLFTLVHELAHIWIAESGLSNEISLQTTIDPKGHPVERFCNEVAAAALMPVEYMAEIDASVFGSQKNVIVLSKALGVSSLAFLVRAYKLGQLSLERYRELRKNADREFEIFVQRELEKQAMAKSKPGGPNPYLLLFLKHGKLFTQVVIDAYRGGFVAPTQASNLLHTQTTKFPKLLQYIY
jgi:Zn-dependent peptidase ImmA (M78 family)